MMLARMSFCQHNKKQYLGGTKCRLTPVLSSLLALRGVEDTGLEMGVILVFIHSG